jgi:hypothetical protein
MKPSKKSVRDATKKISAANADGSLPGKKRRATIGGTRINLPSVRKFGRCFLIRNSIP